MKLRQWSLFMTISILSISILCTSCDDEASEQAQTESTAQQQVVEQAAKPIEVPKEFAAHQMKPIEELKREPTLLVFMDSLRLIVARKDVAALSAILSDNIEFGTEGKKGKAAFLEVWNLNDAGEAELSSVWDAIEDVINGGGAFTNTSRSVYEAPRWATHFPEGYNKDVFAMLNAKYVNVRSRPNRKAKQVARLSYELVIPIVEEDEVWETIGGTHSPWIRVRMANGEEGYVFGKFLRTDLKDKAVFQKVMEKDWLIGALFL